MFSAVHTVDIALALISVLLCWFISMMTLFGVKMKTLQAYKMVFLINAFVDLMYSVNNIVVLMSMTYGVKVVFAIVSNPMIPGTPCSTRIAIGTQLFCMFLSLNVIPLQFMFRYGIIRGRPFSTLQICGVLFLIVLSAVYHGVFTAMAYLPRTEKYDAILHQVLETNQSLPLPSYLAGDLGTTGMVMQLINVSINTCVIYGSIIYFVQKSKKSVTLKCDFAVISKSTVKLQRQMTTLLYAQATLAGVQSKYLGDVLTILVHTPPAFNCISIIVCVPAYRRVTKRALNFARSVVGTNSAQRSHVSSTLGQNSGRISTSKR
ncbi:unnamed protein product [Bursaphelenchus xylophilus]|uniref:(pine wood nematode) hypothetical protein n=1 Tax=Bursaphelenchus xylophilus TaxID=6326 RepID=A0A1I7RJ15_BURXY|nr:unnamed protein product [Bursaphelenchus xylophilus]CAG9119250.1 unnamed protein product [Bursaphelenchus xylophilus]